MTQVTRDTVQHLAQLSSLQLSDDELDKLQGDIANILQYVEQLGELDTTNVAPTYQVTGLNNVWRDDVVSEDGTNREELLRLTPETYNNQIKVPKVI